MLVASPVAEAPSRNCVADIRLSGERPFTLPIISCPGHADTDRGESASACLGASSLTERERTQERFGRFPIYTVCTLSMASP